MPAIGIAAIVVMLVAILTGNADNKTNGKDKVEDVARARTLIQLDQSGEQLAGVFVSSPKGKGCLSLYNHNTQGPIICFYDDVSGGAMPVLALSAMDGHPVLQIRREGNNKEVDMIDLHDLVRHLKEHKLPVGTTNKPAGQIPPK